MTSRASICYLALILIVVMPGTHAAAQTRPSHTDMAQYANDINLVLEAARLSAQQVAELEKQVTANPDDITSRIRLLGFYFSNQFSPGIAQKRRVHLLWMIDHQPRRELTGRPYCGVDQTSDSAGFAAARAAWMAQIEKNPDDVGIMVNAARTFALAEPDTAERLLTRAQQLDPTNSDWPRELSQLKSRQARFATADKGVELARQALKDLEHAYTLADANEQRFMLNGLAKSALEAADQAKAGAYAMQDLATATQRPRDWNTGNSIHSSNCILGRIALAKGDVDSAKRYLLAAGKTPGSPQLDSFGPNMTLAKELLEHDQRDAVLEYFGLCAKFWELGQDKLTQWSATVRGGGIPDFGANLVY